MTPDVTDVTWDDVRAGLARIAKRDGEWAGLPMPVEGTSMVIHPSYPFASRLGQIFKPDYAPELRTCSVDDVESDGEIRNEWYSYRDKTKITLFRDGKRFRFSWSSTQHSGGMIAKTLGAARAWDIEAEIRALETLRRHVTEWSWNAYFMTGTFLETSKKSGVTYFFRRLRPTLAMTSRPDMFERDRGMRILAALCAHPVGYYEGSWAGALVPTDDVISHLLLMRSDEHDFWKQSNQHPAWAPEAGL